MSGLPKTSLKRRCCYYKSLNRTLNSVTFKVRGQNGANLNVHMHMLLFEGVYSDPLQTAVAPRFHEIPEPADNDVADVVAKIATRVIALLRRLGYLDQSPEMVFRPDPIIQ
jgi:hypothetical protein